MSTRYEQRMDDGNLRSYGRLVIELASTVPDGLVVFFVSYSYMDYVIARWHEEGLLAELINHKLIFIETQVSRSGITYARLGERGSGPACMQARMLLTLLRSPQPCLEAGHLHQQYLF